MDLAALGLPGILWESYNPSERTGTSNFQTHVFSYWVDKCSWGWKSADICLGEKQTSLIAGLAGGKVPINRPVVYR